MWESMQAVNLFPPVHHHPLLPPSRECVTQYNAWRIPLERAHAHKPPPVIHHQLSDPPPLRTCTWTDPVDFLDLQ